MQKQKSREEVIKEIYSHGWNKDKVKLIPEENGIKIKGSLPNMTYADLKMELYEEGYNYDKEKKLFIPREEIPERSSWKRKVDERESEKNISKRLDNLEMEEKFQAIEQKIDEISAKLEGHDTMPQTPQVVTLKKPVTEEDEEEQEDEDNGDIATEGTQPQGAPILPGFFG